MKKKIIFIVACIVAFGLALQLWTPEPIDIIGDLEEIRNTSTEAGNRLNQHYANINVFDSLVSSCKYDAAFEFIDNVINNSFNSVDQDNYIFEKGKLLFNLENYEESKNVFTKAINRSDSFNLRAFVWRGYSYAQLGSCDSALVDLEFASRRNSSFQRDFDKVLEYCGD